MNHEKLNRTGSDLLNLNVRYYRWYPPEAHQGYAHESISLQKSKTAFLLVDVYCLQPERNFIQKIVTDQYAQKWYQISTKNIAPALTAARASGLPVIYVNNSAPRIELKDSELGKKLLQSSGFRMWEDFKEDQVDPKEYNHGQTVQLQFPDTIQPAETDYFIRKHCFSGFFETRLESLLKNLKIRNLICVGFVADACLFTTIADAVFRNYKVILLRDCTLASELPDELEETKNTKRTVLWIETIFGSSLTSAEFIQACQTQV